MQRLQWRDIHWDDRRFRVRAVKTERYRGHGDRLAPLFPELQPLLSEVRRRTEPDETFVLPMPNGRTDASLRGPLERAIKRAGGEVRARLWHNLRSTRQTELEDRFPTHVVCK